ncbi:MAG: hypothetical protein ACRDRY_17785 [Pseudonocardiaceae bacterium]
MSTELGLVLSPRVECWRCGHDFEPDSSPHPDACWSCAEEIDGAEPWTRLPLWGAR